MKKLLVISLVSLFMFLASFLIVSCAPTKAIKSKSGNELWSENCGRCHLAPGKSSYTSKEWDAIGLHMRMRAQLPEDEANKIISFLKGED